MQLERLWDSETEFKDELVATAVYFIDEDHFLCTFEKSWLRSWENAEYVFSEPSVKAQSFFHNKKQSYILN